MTFIGTFARPGLSEASGGGPSRELSGVRAVVKDS
jgi:hypothetical protein